MRSGHQRFTAHEKFFVEDVRRWARSRFGVELPAGRTAVFGVSASGELALASYNNDRRHTALGAKPPISRLTSPT